MGTPLSVIPLGVGNAFTTRSFHTSLVVMGGETRVLVDCPSPLGRMLREASESSGVELACNSLDHVVITHLHADHISGLEEFYYKRKYIDHCTAKPHLYVLEENIGPLWDRRLRLSFGDTFDADKSSVRLEDLFHLHQIHPDKRMTIGEMTFRFRRTGHSIPTVGFAVKYGDRSFGYSSDATFDPELIAFLAHADLVFHEAGDGASHTPFEALGALPENVRRKLRLVHLPDGALEEPPGGLTAARAGMIYEIVEA